MSADERAQIESNRTVATYDNPYSGKNRAQRERLNDAFVAMQSARNRMENF